MSQRVRDRPPSCDTADAATAGSWSSVPGTRRWPREVALFAGAYLLYSLAPAASAAARRSRRWRTRPACVALQADLGLNVEREVQEWITGLQVMSVLGVLYLVAQLVAVPLTLVLVYKRRRSAYLLLRTSLLGAWLVAIPIYADLPDRPAAPGRHRHRGLGHPGVADPARRALRRVFLQPRRRCPEPARRLRGGRGRRAGVGHERPRRPDRRPDVGPARDPDRRRHGQPLHPRRGRGPARGRRGVRHRGRPPRGPLEPPGSRRAARRAPRSGCPGRETSNRCAWRSCAPTRGTPTAASPPRCATWRHRCAGAATRSTSSPRPTALSTSRDFHALGGTAGVRHNGSVGRVALSPWSNLRAWWIVRRGGYDVVHLHEPLVPPCLSILLLSGRPMIGTFHMYGPDSRLYGVMAPLARVAVRRLHHRTAVSEAARSSTVKFLRGDYEVIPNGVMRHEHGGGAAARSGGRRRAAPVHRPQRPAQGAGRAADGDGRPVRRAPRPGRGRRRRGGGAAGAASRPAGRCPSA